jgi:hypothetical protein
MRIEWLVGGGVFLIISALFFKQARARQAAVIAGVICLVIATVLNPGILVTFADKVSTVLDGKPPDNDY